MRAISDDLRQRIVDAYEAGEGSLRELAQQYSVHFNSVATFISLYRANGAVTPLGGKRGPKPIMDDKARAILRSLVSDQPDATINELIERFFHRTERRVSQGLMCQTLKAMDLPRKKRVRMQASKSVPTSGSKGRSSQSGSSRSTRKTRS